MAIQVGDSHTVETIVSQQNIASTMGSGLVDVFATPALIAQMECAASRCIEGSLPEGKVSVGTQIDVAHSAATPLGMAVRTTATVKAVDGSRVDFEVASFDDVGEIGRGLHTRFVVDAARFMEKTNAKGKK